MKKLVLFTLMIFFPPFLFAIDLSTGIGQIVDSFVPTLKNKTAAIGLFRDKKTGSRLRFSDILSDEISIALKNKGVKIIVTEERLDMSDKDEFTSGFVKAKILINGSFQKWGEFFVVYAEAIDTVSGEVIAAKTIKINEEKVPKGMLEPVIKMRIITGTGSASINYQCNPDEKPCPPKNELKRRAIDTAKMIAMEDLASKAGVNLVAVNQVVGGRASKKIIDTKTSGQLRNLEFQKPEIQNDEVIIILRAEIIQNNQQ